MAQAQDPFNGQTGQLASGVGIPVNSEQGTTGNHVSSDVDDAVEEEDGDDDDEGDDEEDDEDEIIDLPLVDPCKTIRPSLINALKNNRNNAGSFFSSKTYCDSPNPMVDVDGFGVLGLPLNAAEAKRLISVCEQAPFGMGERTVVDRSVRDTWEVDAAKIKSRNPAWDNWMRQTVAPQICANLGVNLAAMEVKAELYKLLVYEEGSHFLSHQDTEKAPGMFATIVIVLPSEFTGGALQLTHAGVTQSVDIAASSGMSTSALAWYTDVFHAVKPVTSGYRLALSYNLIRTSIDSLKPSAQLVSSTSSELRHILLSWKQAHDGRLDFQVPDTLLYLLDHQYSENNLATCALKGKDASLIAQLDPIAAEMGFGLYIANAELHRTGQANDMGCGYGRSRRYDYYDYEDEYSDDGGDDVSMCEVEEETFSLSNVVDLGGNDIDIDFDPSMDDVIPKSFADGQPSNQEYEGYMGNYGGNLEYWYHRTVLIFSPNKDFVKFGDVARCACEALSSSRTLQPTAREKVLVRQLTSKIRQGLSSEAYFTVLSSSAIRWKDFDVWRDTFDACPNNVKLKCIGNQIFCSALKAFPFPSLEDQLKTALLGDESNGRRLNLVLGILQQAAGDAVLHAWCETQSENVLKSLRKPAVEDVNALVYVVKRHGTGLVRDTILPQLIALSTNSTGDLPFWIAFLRKLKDELATKPANLVGLDVLIDEQVASIVQSAEIFPVRLVAQTGYGYYGAKEHKVAEVDHWLKMFQLCVSTGAIHLFSRFIARIRAAFTGKPEEEKLFCTQKFITPFMSTLNSECSSLNGAVDVKDSVSEFYRFALEAYITRIIPLGAPHYNADVLLVALQHTGDAELLKKSLSPLVSTIAKQHQHTAIDLITHLSQKKSSIGLNSVGIACCKEVVQSLLQAIITSAHLEAKPHTAYPYPYGYSGYGRPSQPEGLGMNLLKLCFVAECHEQVPALLGRLLLPKANCDVKKQISDGLVPLIPHLRTFLESNGRSLRQEPFATFTVKIIKGFINTVMGPKPNEVVPFAQLRNVGCGCQDCGNLTTFFTSAKKDMGIRAVQRVRTHLERELDKIRSWGVTWTTVRSGSPHTLQITKSNNLITPSEWLENQGKGKAMLQSVGNEQELREILGGSLEVIASAVGLRLTLPRAAAPATQPHASGPTSRGVKRLSTTAAQQQPKKKKFGDDVIDLTDSPTK